jgi:hypothetical protein
MVWPDDNQRPLLGINAKSLVRMSVAGVVTFVVDKHFGET